MFGNTLLIVNPQAQSGRARHVREEIAHLLESITNCLLYTSDAADE